MRNKAVILLKSLNGEWVKNQSAHGGAILPSNEADDDGNDDNGGGVIHVKISIKNIKNALKYS